MVIPWIFSSREFTSSIISWKTQQNTLTLQNEYSHVPHDKRAFTGEWNKTSTADGIEDQNVKKRSLLFLLVCSFLALDDFKHDYSKLLLWCLGVEIQEGDSRQTP